MLSYKLSVVEFQLNIVQRSGRQKAISKFFFSGAVGG
jgi:hypothetical protein